MTPVDPVRFRELLGSFATSVAVMAALDANGRPAGITVSALASVSLAPPLLLVCIAHKADFHAVITQASRFGLSVLAEDQERLSRRFAADVDDRFAGVGWTPHATGVPLLDDAAAHIVCAVAGTREAGDHTVFFGEVLDGEAFARQPLLHHRGGYRRLR
jgi:flavin reductase (DIM6/NTAB) family NADH-FMN oxidoreductase RutF